MKRMLCSKQGTSILLMSLHPGKCRKNGISRYGCVASMKIKRIDESEQWVVDTLKLEYNHPLTMPSKQCYLPINHSISSTSRLLFHSLNEVNVSISQQTVFLLLKMEDMIKWDALI